MKRLYLLDHFSTIIKETFVNYFNVHFVRVGSTKKQLKKFSDWVKGMYNIHISAKDKAEIRQSHQANRPLNG